MYNNQPSGPFGLNISPYYKNTGINNNFEQTLAESYAKLEALKNANGGGMTKQNVFSDIAIELKDLSEDELNFITASQDYITTNAQYQREFSEFITEKFANEYIQAGKGKTLEQLLSIIKKRKDQYKSKFVEDISEIRDKNKELADKNAELAKSNEELQKQLFKMLLLKLKRKI
jgi:phosphopantetheinyl transferase (holo-ACP synthase)